MRRVLTIAGKEFRHMLHDRFSLALIVFLPIIQLLIYGYALETQARHVPAAVLNQNSAPAAEAMARRVAKSSLFSIQPGYRSEAEIEAGIRSGAIRIALIIPPGYLPVRVWVDGSDVGMTNYLLGAMKAIGTEALAERFGSHVPGIQTKIVFNRGGSTSAFLIPGLIVILAQTITTLLMALSIASERERGTLEQIMITPIGGGALIAGKALAVSAIGIAECCCLVALMRSLFSIPVQGSAWLLLGILPLLVLAPVGFGLLIAAKARTQFQALQLANVVLLPSVMLSGFVFPREFLRPPSDWVSKFVPATYLVDLTRGIILRGASTHEVALQISIAAGFGILLTTAGVLAMRRSLAT